MVEGSGGWWWQGRQARQGRQAGSAKAPSLVFIQACGGGWWVAEVLLSLSAR